MTDEEFAAFRTSLEDTFNALYAIDVTTLTLAQRQQHQVLLSAAHLAMIRVENKAFEDLTAQAQQVVGPLSASTIALQKQLENLQEVTQILQAVSSVLNVLTSIAALFA